MTFEEWWESITSNKMSDNRKWLAEQAWKAATEVAYNDQGLTIAYMKGYFDGKEKRNEPRL